MKKIYIILFLCFATGTIHSQYELPKYTPQTPTASDMFKYANYPVNHGTGLVDITIPLYEIRLGDIVLPITLKYHSSGIKLMESPSWVGAGWSLVAEPAVSRAVMGSPDEMYSLRKRLPEPYNMNEETMRAWCDGVYDLAPDKFYYQLPDKSGGFYFTKKRLGSSEDTLIVHPFEPIKIQEYLNGSNYDAIRGFNITDDKGIIYNFSNIVEDVDMGSGNYYRSAWKCDNITSQKTGSRIGFRYHPVHRTVTRQCNDVILVEHIESSLDAYIGQYLGYETNKQALFTAGGTIRYGAERKSYSFSRTGTLYQFFDEESLPNSDVMGVALERKLSRIDISDNWYILFSMSTPDGYPRLDNIEIWKQGQRIKTISFNYSPLGYNNDLFLLNNIKIKSKGTEEISQYEFEYYAPGVSPFPNRYSRSFDIWGYYTGGYSLNLHSSVPFNSVDVPSHLFGYSSIALENNQDRLYSSIQGTIYGTLMNIIYPTGGKTEFYYSLNRFLGDNGVEEGAGLRVYQIREYEDKNANNPSIVRSYAYGQNDIGYCNNYPSLDKYKSKAINNYYDYTGHRRSVLLTLRSNPTTSISYLNGAAVVYDEVSEYINDDLKTTYKYAYSSEGGESSAPDPFCPYYSDYRYDWALGYLRSQTEYKKTGSVYEPVRTKEYFYDQYMKRTADVSYNISRKVNHINLGGYDQSIYPSTSDYCVRQSPIWTGCRRIQEDKETIYDGSRQIVTTTQYIYDENSKDMYPRKIKTLVGNNDFKEKEIKYVGDIRLNGTQEEARQNLLSLGAKGTILEENLKRNDTYINSVRYDYKIFENYYRFPLLEKVSEGTTPENRITRAHFKEYTPKGSPLSVTINDDEKALYIWANHGTQLIAEIKNLEYRYLIGSIPRSVLDDLDNSYCPKTHSVYASLNQLRSMEDILVTTYVYDPLFGISEITDSRGVTTYYEYDDFGRLKASYLEEGGLRKKVQEYDYQYRNQ